MVFSDIYRLYSSILGCILEAKKSNENRKHLNMNVVLLTKGLAGAAMPGKSIHKKPTIKQAHLTSDKEDHAVKGEQVETAHFEMNLSPIVDRRSYDNFIKVISLRIYTEFEKKLRENGVDLPELKLVGFELLKTPTDLDVRMANYVAVNSRLVLERAFIDPFTYAEKHMPRVMRQVHELGADKLQECMENKIQHDIMMEIRSIAIMHVPEDRRFKYISNLKEL